MVFQRSIAVGKKAPKYFPIFLLVLFFLILTGGCAFLQPTLSVEVVLSTVPWEETGIPVFYLLRFPSPDGEGISILRLPVGTDRVVIELPRGSSVPVLAYPLGRLKPQGGLLGTMYRAEGLRRHGVLRLEAEAGALAELFLSLQREQLRCSTVNAAALVEEMTEEGNGDPWACDIDRIRQAVLTGSLNYLQVRDVQRYSCSALLPADDWIAESALWGGDIESEARGPLLQKGCFRLEFHGLYPGCHRYYSPGTGLELHIHVDKKGGCRMVYDSLTDFSTRF